MSSRATILKRIRSAGVPASPLPSLASRQRDLKSEELLKQFEATLQAIGGSVVSGLSLNELSDHLLQKGGGKRLVNTCEFLAIGEQLSTYEPHALENVFLAVVPGTLAVAENGAVWVAEQQMKVRALPFICEHLALVVEVGSLVANMHEAYQKLGSPTSDFGVFIAGPSKTADIEQSLVIGAHGCRSLQVFLTP